MQTVLHDHHVAKKAKLVDFSGWEMPLYYSSIIAEHLSVRKSLGLFDVSHMGTLAVQGKDAEAFLDHLSTNHIASHPNYSAIYTVFCNENGTAIDDLLIYKRNPSDFLLIVNASNRLKCLTHLQECAAPFSVSIQALTNWGTLALQGPLAMGLAKQLFPTVLGLNPMTWIDSHFQGVEITIARTGYTGSDGIELMGPLSLLPELWQQILVAGEPLGIVPVGLGARDTLRLEMGYALYGHELNDQLLVNETVAAWTIKWDKADFIGKSALQKNRQSKRREWGLLLPEGAIPRAGFALLIKGERGGYVTSGGYSPCLQRPIALAYAEQSLEVGQKVAIEIRNRPLEAEVVKVPFIKKGKSL